MTQPSTHDLRALYDVPRFRLTLRRVRLARGQRLLPALLSLFLLFSARATAQDALPDLNSWRQQKSYALLFATDDYEYWKSLSGPVPDATELKNVLEKKYGFQTELVVNATREEILTKLRQYEQRQFNEADQLLVFFAGHGFRDPQGNQGYLVAKDTKLASDDLGLATFESYDDLRGKIDAIRVKHLLLVLDACFGGTFDGRLLQTSTRGDDSAYASLADRFKDRMQYQTRRYLASGGDQYVPDTSASGHSPFVKAFLQTLHDHDQKYFAVPDLEAALQSVKPQPRGGDWGSDQPGSEFFFVSKACVANNCGNPSETDRPVSPPPPAPAAIKVAVMGFKNIAGHADPWVSDLLASEITADIGAKGGLELVSADAITETKAQLSLSDSAGYTKDSLEKLNMLLGANYVITGSYWVQKNAGRDQIQVDIVVQNATTGQTVAAFPETGIVSNLTELSARSGEDVRSRLPISAAEAFDSSGEADAGPMNPEAIRDYRDGLKKLESYNLLGARDSLQKAVELEPDSATIQVALSRTWSELGYDEKAKAAAGRAYDISKRSSSLKTKWLMQANYDEVSSQWDQAASMYKQLWQAFPDDANYALALARVQTSGDKSKDALATLASLRTQVPSSVEDPRVDLDEAIAAGNLGDAAQQHKAAIAAHEKATKLGSHVFLAEAYWQECAALGSLGQLKAAETACGQANTNADLAGAYDVKARTLTVLANVMIAEGQQSSAMDIRKEILAKAREVGSQKDIVGALVNLANSQSMQGQFDDAEKSRREAMDRAVAIGDKGQFLKLQNDRALDLQEQGRYQDAAGAYEQSLQTAREIGDQNGIGTALVNLGGLQFQLGHIAEGEKEIRECMEIAQRAQLGDLYGSALLSLGDVQMARDEMAGAQASYQDAYRRFEKIGDQDNIASSQLSLAKWSLEEDKPDAAITLAQQAAAMFEKDESTDLQVDSEITIARALLKQGKLTEVDAELAAAGKLEPRDRIIRLSLVETRAQFLARKGDVAEAKTELTGQLDQCKSLGLVLEELDGRLALAQMISDPSIAMAQLEATQNEAAKIGDRLIARKASEVHDRFATSTR